MTLRDLEYFLVIAREKSITRAASVLFVAQPALSQCIRKLENEVGTQLFARSSSGVVLTSEGNCFLSFAENVLSEKSTFERKLFDVKNAENGEVFLGFSGAQAAFVLPHILPAFQEKHPNISIHLVEGTSDEIEQKLFRHEIDLAILHAPVLCKDLDYFEAATDEMVVVPRSCSNYKDFVYTSAEDGGDYIHPEFFRTEPIAMTNPGQRSRMIFDQIFAGAGIVPSIIQSTRNLSTLDALAQVNYASVLLPKKQLSLPLIRRGFFSLPPQYAIPYTFVVAIRRGSYLPIAAEKLQQAFYDRRYTF